jgi:hypothetical protein
MRGRAVENFGGLEIEMELAPKLLSGKLTVYPSPLALLQQINPTRREPLTALRQTGVGLGRCLAPKLA